MPSELQLLAGRRYGHDFASVRMHCGTDAARAAGYPNAAAFTTGRDIVFSPGYYQPRNAPGKRLLAHKLAHVVQQTRGSSRDSGSASQAEIDADRAADAFMRGTGHVDVMTATAPGVFFQTPPAAVATPSPQPVLAVYQESEEQIGAGRMRIRVWGNVGDAIPRPGLEKKYPLPKSANLPNYDRWHLAGPDATGVTGRAATAIKSAAGWGAVA